MTVWMRHPNLSDALIEVPDASVPGHRLMGWRETDPPPPPQLNTEETSGGSALVTDESRSATASGDKDKEE